MTNLEKYFEKVYHEGLKRLAVKDGEPCDCKQFSTCKGCDFAGTDCENMLLQWLLSPVRDSVNPVFETMRTEDEEYAYYKCPRCGCDTIGRGDHECPRCNVLLNWTVDFSK